jgi:NMD protein affecting ribosome stability and mRNA decay
MQRFIQGHLPPSFNNVWVTNEARRNETVSMSLRNSDDFFVPVSRLKSYENMPLYSFPKAWSLLTDHSITIIRNRAEFNAKLKEYFLSQLSFTVNCTKAYCPSCNRFLNS